MSCGICGRAGDAPFLLADERSIGVTCGDDRCGALLWESAVIPPDDEDGRRILRWRVRRHQAAMNGRPFREPNPVDAELMRAVLDFEELTKTTAVSEGNDDAVPGF